MNKARRKQLDKALLILADAATKTAEARAAIVSVRDDEQEAYDNMSEGAQEGDNGQAIQSAITALDEAIDELDTINLARVNSKLEECEVDGTDLPEATLSPDETDARREARLPQWVKDRIAKLEKNLSETEERSRNMFAEPTGKPKEFINDDYDSPIRGHVLPVERILIPGANLRIEVSSRDGLLEITYGGLGFGRLKVIPNASNSLFVGVDER